MSSKNSNEYYTEDFNSMINIIVLNSMGFFFFGFMIPIVARINMNASALEVGIVISMITIGFIASSTFVGIITDRTSLKKRLIVIGSLGRGSAYIVLYFAIIVNSLIFLGIGTLVLGFFAGFYWIPLDTLIAQKSSKDHRSHTYGKRESANAKGQIIGALIGFGILLGLSMITDNPFLLYSAFLLYAVANLIAGIKFFTQVDESIKFYDSPTQMNELSLESTKPPSVQFTNIMIIGLMVLCSVILFSSINHSLARPFLNVYVLENITDEISFIILAYLPSTLLATLLAPKLGKFADKIPPLLGITVAASLGAFITFLLISTTNIWVFAILLLIDLTIGLSAGLIFMNLMSRINIQHRGKVFGLASFFSNFGAAMGPILGGYVYDNIGSKAPFIISIFVELLMIPLYLVIIKILIPYAEETYD